MAQESFKRRLTAIFSADVDCYIRFTVLCAVASFAFIGSCTKEPPRLYTNYKTSLIRFLDSDETLSKSKRQWNQR